MQNNLITKSEGGKKHLNGLDINMKKKNIIIDVEEMGCNGVG
jgi:hypothetical protein